jgi:hypothetical protein
MSQKWQNFLNSNKIHGCESSSKSPAQQLTFDDLRGLWIIGFIFYAGVTLFVGISRFSWKCRKGMFGFQIKKMEERKLNKDNLRLASNKEIRRNFGDLILLIFSLSLKIQREMFRISVELVRQTLRAYPQKAQALRQRIALRIQVPQRNDTSEIGNFTLADSPKAPHVTERESEMDYVKMMSFLNESLEKARVTHHMKSSGFSILYKGEGDPGSPTRINLLRRSSSHSRRFLVSNRLNSELQEAERTKRDSIHLERQVLFTERKQELEDLRILEMMKECVDEKINTNALPLGKEGPNKKLRSLNSSHRRISSSSSFVVDSPKRRQSKRK